MTSLQCNYEGPHRRTVRSETPRFYYSQQWQIVEERMDSSSSPDKQYVWGIRYMDDLVLRDWDSDGDGTLDDRRYAVQDYFNVTAMVNTSGTVQERSGYEAYGTMRVMDANFGGSSSTSATSQVSYGGYVADSETGLYQARNLFLHPKLGRWISRDPLGEKSGANLYRFVENNPINLTDLEGLETQSECYDRCGREYNLRLNACDQIWIIGAAVAAACPARCASSWVGGPLAYAGCVASCIAVVAAATALSYGMCVFAADTFYNSCMDNCRCK